MFKKIALASMLLSANVAFACGGNKDCAHCGDHAAAATTDISKAPGKHLTFAVEGMKCGACSTKITKALEAIDGVNAVSVDHESGRAEVAFDEKKTGEKAMVAAIEALEFKAKVADAKQG